MNVLVTGANGFLGRHVVAELLRRGHHVRAMVRPAARVVDIGWPPEVGLFRADLRVARNLVEGLDGVDVLVHLAAAVTGGDDAQFAAGVVGTERLMEAVNRSGVRRIVLASSFSVYDWDAARDTLTEETPVAKAPGLYDRDGYAVAKVWQERVARKALELSGKELVVLRPGFIWGRGNEHLAGLGQKVGPVYLAFGPRTRIPLTHVENCAACFALAAESFAAAGETFNVVDGDDVRVWKYLGDYLKNARVRAVPVPVPYHAALGFVRLAQVTSKAIFRGKGKLPSLLVPCRFVARFKPLRYQAEKAARVLGWRPALSYDEALWHTYGPESPGIGKGAATPREPATVPSP